MKTKAIHQYFPFARLLRLLAFMAIGLQLIVVSHMYFYKVDLFNDPMVVLVRLFRGTI